MEQGLVFCCRVRKELLMKKKWWILISVALAFFLVNFDGGLIGIMLPTIQTSFGAEFYQVQWISLAGSLALVVTLALAGRLGDALGKKAVFSVGTLIYLAGTILFALSPSVTTAILFRVIQGVGLAVFLTLGTAIVTEVFEERRRGLALGIYNLLGLVGLLAGPVAAGALLQAAAWNTAFWVAAALSAVVLLLARLVLPAPKERSKLALDVKGTALLLAVLASLLLALTFGQNEGFTNPLVLGLFGVFAVALVVFIIVEKRAAEPIILIALFRNRKFVINFILLLFSMIALSGYSFLMPFYMQNVLRLSAMEMGVTLAIVFGLVMALVAPVGGVLSDKIGSPRVTMIGILFLLGGTIGASWLDTASTQLAVLLHFLPIGMGMGLIVTPATSAIMGTIPSNRLGMGSGLVSIAINMAQTMGIAILGSFWSSRVYSVFDAVPDGGASSAPPDIQAGALRETFILAACLLAIAFVLNIWEVFAKNKPADSGRTENILEENMHV